MSAVFAAITAHRRPGGMLRFAADRWSLAYLAAMSLLFVVHWQSAQIQPLLVILACAMAYGAGCIQHDHAHLPMWRSPACNLLTSCWIALLRGDGPWSWLPTHIANHHRYTNRPGDWTLTRRTGSGMHLGHWLVYTVIGLVGYVGAALHYLGRALWRRPRHGVACLLQVGMAVGFVGLCWWADPQRAWWLVVVPQAFGVIAMIATGYPQHHQADPNSDWAHSRDFVGRLNNWLHFNHGYHTVHHVDRSLHWSEWPAAHALIADRLDPRLVEASLPGYLLRTFVVAPFVPRLRSPDLSGA